MRLRQVLTNLLGNAVKFTRAGEVRLTVRWLAAAGEVAFDVADTGIGMTPAEVARLFRPFTQADTSTTRKYGGTGLGLTISMRLTELLGGRIAVESTPGRGSRFTFSVATAPPLTPAAPAPPPCPVAHPFRGGGANRHPTPVRAPIAEAMGHQDPPHPAQPPAARRVLLAEDGPDNQRILRHFLERAGLQVVIVETGLAACERALAAVADGAPFDLILMDMQMPEMDGYAATAHLRGHGYRGPIVALTANAMETDRERCIAAGCDDFATKPIDRARLVELVGRYTAAPAHETTTIPARGIDRHSH